jgi:K(+)-stimulated pyrophosphate-energized sodium pump
VIADNVGDNVGDCAGMAADLFETYAVTIVATMVLASIYFATDAVLMAKVMAYPLVIAGACIITSVIGTYFVRLGKSQNIMGALYKGLIVTGILSAIALWPITDYMLGMNTPMTAGTATFTGTSLFWCGIIGLPSPACHRLDHRILHQHRLSSGPQRWRRPRPPVTAPT